MKCECGCCAGKCGCTMPCANNDVKKKQNWHNTRKSLNDREGRGPRQARPANPIEETRQADIGRWRKQ